MVKKFRALLLGALLSAGSLQATHIVGGYINYFCFSGNTYEIQLYLYRDCAGVGFDNTAAIGVFNVDDSLIMTLTAQGGNIINIPPTTSDPCLSPPSSVCVEQRVYSVGATLTASAGGYTLAYQRCCRNGSINNLVNPGAIGATYWAKIPDPGTYSCNDAPYFSALPPIAICYLDSFYWDHSAFDGNGDSLSYYLCEAKVGGTPGNPAPNPPGPPPYSPPTYVGGYSPTYPMPGAPGLAIDPVTGWMTAFPNGTGQFVVAICIDEFRSGVKIGEYRREFQFNVVSCSVNVNPLIAGTNVPGTYISNDTIWSCDSYTFSFGNASTGAPLFWWDFGTGNIGDTSIQINPTFTFPDTGFYTVTLIANKGYYCADTAYATVGVFPGTSVDFTWSTPLCDGMPVQFTDQTSLQFGNVVGWDWSFQGGTPSTSNQQNPSVTFTGGGSHTVELIVTTSMGCIDTLTRSVFINPAPNVNLPNDITLCVGADTLINTAGSSVGSWVWTPGSSGLSCYNCPTPIASPTVATTYTATLTSPAGCVNTGTITVNLADYPVVDAGADVVICNTGNTQLNATATDTSGIASWQWTPTTWLSPPHNVPNPFANPNPGTSGSITYYVTATNAWGCASTDSVVIQRNWVTVDAGADASYCVGGSAQLNGTSPNAPVTWSWAPAGSISGSSTVSNPIANPTTTTVFTVTVTDTDNCTATDSVTVTVHQFPPVDAGLNTSICTGGTTTLTATGASTYVWQPGGQTSASIVVSPGAQTTYTVTGTDANGCVNTDSVTVFVLTEPLVYITPDTFMCQGGSLQLTSSGPAGSTFQWSPSAFLTNPTSPNPVATPPVSTTYSLTVTDPTGCFKDTMVSITIQPLPTISASVAPAGICDGQSATLSASGAGAGGTYTWMPGGMTGTPVVVTPSVSTIYTVTGTNQWGCSRTATASLTVNPVPTVSAGADQVICSGDPATLTAVGNGVTYSWQPGGQSGSSIAVNPASTTTYTVTAAIGGCTSTDQVTVTVNALPTVTASTPDPDICAGASATLNASGANTYNWMPGGLSGSSVSVTPASTTTYTVTGTDGNGCQNTSTVTVTVHVLPTVTASTVTPDICVGASATITASGATTYTWMPGSLTGSSITVTPLSTTTYTVTGSDAFGCQGTDQVTVTVHNAPAINAGADQSICAGDNATLTATGAGVGGTYSWMPGSLSGSSITVTPGATTTYTVTGTDQWGCTNTDDVTVTVTAGATINASTPTPDVCTGSSATINASGGVTYVWQPGGLTGSSVTVTPATTTTYTVTGTDANGCTGTNTVTITVRPLPAVDAGADQDICTAGSATLTATGAGAGGTYLWQPGAIGTASITVTPGATTIYTVTGTDAFGCQNTDQATVTVHGPPPIDAGPDQAICDGSSATLTASGGVTYVWQPGGLNGTSITVTPTVQTMYTVTGTDQFGCTNTDSVTVSINSLPTLTVTPDMDICLGDNPVLNASGAATYVWQPGNIQGASIIVNPTSTTTYNVTGTDANGCDGTGAVTVTVLPLPNVNAGLDQAICIGESAQLNATGADTYVWSPAATLDDPNVANPVATPAVTQTYMVTGTGANGCVNSDNVDVTVNPLPSINANLDVYVYEGQCIQLQALGGSSYTWSPPTFLDDPSSATPTSCPDDTITYYLTGVDGNGCLNIDSTTVFVIGLPIADLPTAFTPNNDGLNDVFRVEEFENFNLSRLVIYNRWGDLVYETGDIATGWDGTIDGQLQPMDTYVYMVSGIDEKGASVWRQGNVTLIR